MIFEGSLLCVEGPDGVGKTMAVNEFVNQLRQQGHDVVQTREPGGCPSAEQIRELMKFGGLLPLPELLVMLAARAQHMEEVIYPAVRDGKIVVTDRFNLSTYAYQGFGRQLGIHTIMRFEELISAATRFSRPTPDHYVVLMAPYEVTEGRRTARNGVTERADNFEIEEAFRKRVHAGYEHMVEAGNYYFSHKLRVIDANQSLVSVGVQIANFVKNNYPPKES
jgi:dTMP kinase